ncbi:MAG: hypothetical protein HN704_02435 [Bacteroidetes bacterium]|jgi:predicted RNA-binding Zn-ribbon protein involved in translation (DUF1610 family)|nr:hypothetical protein [Bacteroidota bacterium]MBT6686368.1 hypothetical protein [Bacteroidota bacterium]MBT7142201.1 hypothetical protein [Bacteroidota bacterium]MBT7490444.1 hypothetical protein [Bacteroidota bacterium]
MKKISLRVKCPVCHESLLDEKYLINDVPSVKLNIETDGKRGNIRLCSTYSCFNHESSIEIGENAVVDFFCPECNQKLISNTTCSECDAPLIPFVIESGGKVLICSRKGCDKHFVAFENISDAMRKMHDEYGV